MKLSTRILLGFTLVLLLSVVDSASNYWLSVKVRRNTEYLSRSQEIIRNSARLHKSIIDMQSSLRGYLLTEDTSFLDGYSNGLTEIPLLFSELESLLKDNNEQPAILDSIKILHHSWTDYAEPLIDARRNMPESMISKQIFESLFETKLKKQTGKIINDNMARKFLLFDRIEYRTRNMHSTNLIASIQRTHIYSLVFLVLTVVIGIATTIYIVSLISKRIRTMVTLAEDISKGKFTTIHDNRRDELTGLSNSLSIMSENLRRSIGELQSRNTELDQFAYVVSHDLKAPIRGIHNVINWIEEDLRHELSPEMQKYLDIINQRIRRMEDLINGLLEYARVRQKTEPERTDVGELVNYLVEDIVPREYTVEVENLPVITTEKLKLRQVFANLISNAAKYTALPNGIITIGYKEFQDHYEFFVRDNGIGIDAEYHGRIFDMFQTLREKDEKESTGLGLALVKKILDDQHCTIRISSAAGKGAEFIFTWPRENRN